MFQLNSYSYKEQISFISRRFLKSAPLTWLNVRGAFKAKKPLVFTARVKRLIFTESIFLVAILFNFHFGMRFLMPESTRLLVGVIILGALALCFQTPFVFLANFINTPLEALVRHHYIHDAKRILKEHPGLIVVGVTGSYGKTSTKSYVTKLLSAKYNVLATPQSYNTPMGICMTIRTELRGFHDVFVVEMGAKKRGEIAEICRIIQPNIGILTSIGPAHLETFGSLENTVKTKFELIKALGKSSKSSRKAFINGDNELLASNLKQHLPPNVSALTYGLLERNDVQASAQKVDASGSVFTVDGITYQMPLVGAHNISNVAAAVALARHLGVEDAGIARKLQRLSAPEHRLELKKKSSELVILDDAYNSNPAGAKAALDVLEMMSGFRVVVTPGMVELGDAHIELNYNFGRQIAHVADFVCLVGPRQTKPIQDGLESAKFDSTRIFVAKTVEEGIAKALQIPTEGGQTRFVLLENDLPDNYKE